MKKVMKKSISCFLILCLPMSFCLVSFASENQATKEIQNEFVYDNLPDPFSSNLEFAEIEKGILDYITTSNLEIEMGSEKYVDLMYSILYGEVNNISEVTERYFYDYASVYVVEAQRILAVENANVLYADA